ncbi:hypothetical protein PENANT_c003G03590 [Penicillium antarcticum]|uniref:Uncharacterized protein n=1 Tax=Penicillium antarcticum TaxID=416450 RepID=A0A1V6QI75_9EURO|nr:hypothetical protein PENANT_c003G03590 [Penicillium antarcticum]
MSTRDLTANNCPLAAALIALPHCELVSDEPKPCQIQNSSALPASSSSPVKITSGDTSRRRRTSATLQELPPDWSPTQARAEQARPPTQGMR